MRLLFVSAQMPGHLDWGGYLATAVALQARGHEVLWASGQAVASLVTQMGVPFHPLQATGWRWPPPPPLTFAPTLTPAEIQQQRALRALDQWLDEERVSQACVELSALARAYQPDLIGTEMFISAAGLVAELLAKPLIVVGWPAFAPKAAASNPAVGAVARQRLQRLCAQFQLTGSHWTQVGPPALLSELLHLTYWSPRWYNGLTLLSQTQHVGGLVATPATTSSEQPFEPQVFITLGTSFGNDINFFIMAAQAVQQLGCVPVLALGGQLSATQRATLTTQLADNAIVREMVDLSQMLPQVAAAIHHGGAGTTHALVMHGVPQIIVPHAADQGYQAQGVVRSGVGFYLPPKEVTVERLVAALAQLLPDRSPYRAQAAALRTEFASLGGVQAAAHIIEQLLS